MTAAPASQQTDHFGEEAVGFKWTEGDSRDDRWQQMQSGSLFSGTISHPGGPTLKGLVIRVGDHAEGTLCYDTDLLRVSAAWTDGFLQFNPARFGLISPPAMQGKLTFASSAKPGWAKDGKFDDPRPKPSGPLPRAWARYRGLYRNGPRVVLEYEVQGVRVLETPWLESRGESRWFSRTMEIPSGDKPLTLSLGMVPKAFVRGLGKIPAAVHREADEWFVDVGPRPHTARIQVAIPITSMESPPWPDEEGPPELERLVHPGKRVWTETITTRGVLSQEAGPYVLDTLTLPVDNPYKALLFCSGHDFFSNGDAAVCTAHGDVWRVSGITPGLEKLTWARMATGLFQPLGLKILRDQVYVLGRDQLTRLHDRNNDGEADYYENVNNDGQITANAHEFATCLETDSAGNFYYLRGDSGSQTDHDGCLLRVSPEGSKLDVVATGFRNANGLSIGPGDVITVSPQEGNWTPASAIFQVERGGFYGAMQSHHRDEAPRDFDKPLCWIPRLEDNSSGGQTWVVGHQWGPLTDQLLHFSFGTCKAFLVVREGGSAEKRDEEGKPVARAKLRVAGTVAFPLDFASGVMRGRFRTADGQLYVTGLKGWVSRAVQDGCFQRVRYTGQPVDFPIDLATYQNGLAITFTSPLHKTEAENPDNWNLQQWNYRWSAEYGSPELKVSQPLEPGRDAVNVVSATLFEDGRTVFLEIPRLQPVMQLAVGYVLKSAEGRPLSQTLNLTLNRIGDSVVPESKLVRRQRAGQLSPELVASLVPGLERNVRPAGESAWADTSLSRMAALHVGPGESVSPLVRPGPFEARYAGYLNAPVRGQYVFALSGAGTATLEINGVRVAELRGQALPPPIERVPVERRTVLLHRGQNAFVLNYRSPAEGAATLRAFWSGEGFATEPIPPTVLQAVPDSPSLKTHTAWRAGRDLVEEHRCLRCHSLPSMAAVPTMEGPRLEGLRDRLDAAWLSRWLLAPHSLRPDARMPALFNVDKAEDRQAAADLVAWLAGDQPAVKVPEIDPHQREKGLVLFETLGCIACHRFTAPEEKDDLQRVSLLFAAAKYRGSALESFLKSPHAHDPRSRMPDFRLSDAEIAPVVALLRARGTPLDPAPKGNAANGLQVATERGCHACHAFSQEEPSVPKTLPMANLGAGCLGIKAKQGAVPRFALTAGQVRDVQAYLKPSANHANTLSPTEQSRRAFERLRCDACHPRDGRSPSLYAALGEDTELGLSPEVFPNLSWTGERLHAGWMAEFISGKSTDRPRPWLRARMPSFPADGHVLAHGFAREHGYPSERPTATESNPDLIKAGAKLVEKNGGLDCRQCHAIGSRPASGDQTTQIALGINFALASQRIHGEFFERFVRDPPRFDPGNRMPILIPDGQHTAATGIYHGDAKQQLQALWAYLKSLERSK